MMKEIAGRVEKVIPARFNSKNGYWVVGYKVSGAWKYFWRRKESDALETYEHLCALRDEVKANISRRSTDLTESQLSEAELSIDKLKRKYGAETLEEKKLLLEAVEFYIKNTPTLNAPYLNDVVDMFLEYKEKRLAEVTHKDYLRTLGKFRMVYGELRVHEITTKRVREFFDIYSNHKCRLTHQYLNSFFEFCRGKDNPFLDDGRGWIESNPITWKTPQRHWRNPTVLPFTAVVNMLMQVGPLCSSLKERKWNMPYWSRNADEIISYYIFRLFSMIRKHEYLRMIAVGGQVMDTNPYIDWERRRIIMTPDIYKKRGSMTGNAAGRIFEPICDTFWEWLLWMKDMRIRLSVPNARHGEQELKNICKEEKLTGKNILRHTAVTYHLLKFKNIANTSACAGTSLGMIQKHYWGQNTPTSDAENFYQFTPQKAMDMNVIRSS